MKMHLQYFAKDSGSDPNSAEGQTEGSNETEGQSEGSENEGSKSEGGKTFTQEELDRIVADSVAREQKKAQEALNESKKLQKMNADQKRDYENEKLKSEVEEAKATLAKYQMTDTARKMLSEKGINATDEDLQLVTTSEAESTQKNVEQMIAFADRIRSDVKKEFMRGTTPRETGSKMTGVTQSDFDSMSYDERTKIQQTNPDLFKKLTGGF
ncbi:hypothetical protein IV38_GL000108 [Lactobacillus selangorensis]|uniref:DUF4355 domain-containing protein n=1 Tax=Lactobacillus selangorensis TaxID=81857 RepID=A0A0R2FVE4_9LACO|nr:DUF4355 domain-containing protein [Lactobacillus selangorensis]KRN29228.1 hypothetical protein IV38_GL000108 [Lactobacillus selangorensis]KRN31414.1 hypothetical protein IV40_GL001410 [Lactobacillus selangorensis]